MNRSRELFEESLARARRLGQDGKLADAVALCRMMLQDHPDHDGLITLFGTLCLCIGKRKEGIECLQRSLSINEKQPVAHMNLGLAFKADRCWPEAIARLSWAVELEPGLFDGWTALMEVAGEQGDWRRKLRCLQSMGGIFPERRQWARVNLCDYLTILVSERIVTADEILDVLLEVPTGFEEFMERSWAILRQPPPDRSRAEVVVDVGESLVTLDLDSASCILLALMWRHLCDAGWNGGSTPLPCLFEPGHFRKIVGDYSFPGGASYALRALGYELRSSPQWNAILFNSYILPTLEDWPETADAGSAIQLETASAFAISQQPHTEAQARHCFELLAPHLRKISQQANERRQRISLRVDTAPPVVAFISNMCVNGCSPDKVIIRILSGLHAHAPEFTPKLVAFDGITDSARTLFSSINVEVVDMERIRGINFLNDRLVERLDALRSELVRRRVAAIVYYNCSDGFALLGGDANLAPVQIYYSMGYHYMDGPCWDGFFGIGATGETSRSFDGRTWRTIETASLDPYLGPVGAQCRVRGQMLRQTLSASIVVGTICRPQKIDNDAFMDSVGRILAANPKAVFLWFGSEELPSVRRRMQARGISERCLFQGWVDSPTYALAIDVYLDSYPAPSGLAMFDAMWAGCATVFMDTPQSWAAGALKHLAPLLRGEVGERAQQELAKRIYTHEPTGESLLLLAGNVDSCVAHVQRLIDDQRFRQAVGRANQNFMQQFKNDDRIAARSFCNALSETIEHARRKVASG